MLLQLSALHLDRVLIADSGSTFPPMLRFLSELKTEGKIVLEFDANVGPRVFYEDRWLYSQLPDTFILTDSDLEFNRSMPVDFLKVLESISAELEVGKVGLALSISDSKLFRDDKFTIGLKEYTIREWEEQFWQFRIFSQGSENVFSANVDTTFAYYNKKYFDRKNPYQAVRLAGEFTVRHLPWYRDQIIPEEEAVFYANLNRIGWYGLRK